MKNAFKIELATYAPNMSAGAAISAALGFSSPLSAGTVIDMFAGDIRHSNGVFRSKHAALAVAEKINQRAAFGGFGSYWTGARVVRA